MRETIPKMTAAAAHITTKQRIYRVLFFFPFQLLWVHLKKNHILLFFWIFIFAFITKSIALKYGIPYLFLYPEYLGEVNFLSHLILGFSCGGFIMAFNISSYIINGFRFPFIATLSRPFFKYSLNNSIIPLAFLGTYLYSMADFQLTSELLAWSSVLMHMAGFLTGVTLIVAISFSYFFSTNKDVFKLKRNKRPPEKAEKKSNPVGGVFHRKTRWHEVILLAKEWRVDTYLSSPFKVALARGSEHYDREMLKSIFAQNHINASLFELLVIASVLVLGWFRESPVFLIPAGASILLFFTMLLMFSSALHSWLKGWSTLAFIAIFVLFNYLSQFAAFNYSNHAYGMDYTTEKAVYNEQSTLSTNIGDSLYQQDVAHTIGILENWKAKNMARSMKKNERPKLVIISTSGGGLRSAMWTFASLQHADSLLNGELLNHTQLITGSSGGMIGASYIREMYLQSQENKAIDFYDPNLVNNVNQDILNPIALTIAVNDLFLRLQRFQDGPYTYVKDRAYAFEQQLNTNTNFVLDKRLSDYTAPEASAQIPMMVLSPTIANDGRRLLIASQPISYLSCNLPSSQVTHAPLSESIEFSRFFEKQNAQNLRFLSALRMSATFPYVLPEVTLPSEPQINAMDAGMRDNFGMLNTVRYIYTFREWLQKNTSGIVILQIRDQERELPNVGSKEKTIWQLLTAPLGAFYKNWVVIQQYHHDELIQYASAWYDKPIDIVEFQLRHDTKDAISLSWHLTQKEKEKISTAVFLPENQKSISKLKQLLD